MEERQKAGVIIDDFPLSDWEERVVDSIRTAPCIELLFILRLDGKEAPPLIQEQVIEGSVTQEGVVGPGLCARIERYQPDWVLSLSRQRLSGQILDVPEYGVWAYRHYNEILPFLGDFRERNKTSLIHLDCLKQDGYVVPLREACISVKLDSYRAHLEKVEAVTSLWPVAVSRELASGTLLPKEEEKEEKGNVSLRGGRIAIRRTEVLHRWKRLYRKLFGYEFWNVGMATLSVEEMLGHQRPDIHWFKQREGLYYADPFLYRRNGQWKVIMEEVDHRFVKGFLTEWSISGGELVEEQKAVLAGDSHLSYPYVVHEEGELYCIPENSEAGSVTLYQYRDGWKVVKTLIGNFPAVDSTLIRHEGRWWLFCTRASAYNGDNEELHIFHADDLFGEWLPHKANPVKVDARSSRPAGTPFYYEGVLYRPAQDCSLTYGGAIVVNRVTRLSEDGFSEEVAGRLDPDPASLYPDGIHTVAMNEGMVVMDGKRTEYHVKHLWKKMYRYRPLPLEKALRKPIGRGKV
ncbi:hypothetical protein U0355_03600 [Salimicrobium sp. PL1-032A]|uniref:glucosamine inositolphosphorylceramide transferase family protein n=1 Tax=Salimicrobium sp. PL1-032A TaxID=3095364 RepID=UPI003261816D